MRKQTARRMATGLLVLLTALVMGGEPCQTAEKAESVPETTASEETTAAPVVRKGLTEENGKIYYYKKGKKLTKTWKTITTRVNGKKKKNRYYFRKNGAACTTAIKWKGDYYCFSEKGVLNTSKKNKLFQAGKYKYCPDKNGKCQKGWLVIGKKLYYADKKGRIVTDKKIHGIRLKSSGQAKTSTASKLKILAIRTVEKRTKPSMTKKEKLKACWNYLTDSDYFSYSYMSPNLKKKGWQKTFAYKMLRSRSGSCESFACAFAAMASAIGYDPIIYYGRVPGSRDQAADGFTRHCWVKIKGKYYDPEAEFAGWMTGVYGEDEYPIRHKIIKTLNFEDD